MTFVEKLLIVILSVLMSILANLLYRFMNDNRTKLLLRKEFDLLLNNLEASICNREKDAVLCKASMENFIKNFLIVQRDKELYHDFMRIVDIYNYHRAGGYLKDNERLEKDLEDIRNMKEKKR